MAGYAVLPILGTAAPSATFPAPVNFAAKAYITGHYPSSLTDAGEGFPSFP
jgi:hypothetical protein